MVDPIRSLAMKVLAEQSYLSPGGATTPHSLSSASEGGTITKMKENTHERSSLSTMSEPD